MDTIRLRNYQEKLLRRKKEIAATAEHLKTEKEQLTGQRQLEWLDQAWDETELRLLDFLGETYVRESRKIEKALDKISSGDYGLCLACHRPIPRERLDAFPEAEFCFGCQDVRERFESL
jgi:RNA polymerase-binding transcription factor DksA